MLRKALPAWVLGVSLAGFGGTVFADTPTLHQVYQAAETGRLDQAQSMMDQVIQAHPNSAKAHFVEAELSVKEGRLSNAETELGTAQRLEPGLPFAKPQAVATLKARIAAAHQTSSLQSSVSTTEPTTQAFPWGMVLLGIGLVALFVWFIRSVMGTRNSIPMAGNYSAGMPGSTGQPMGGGAMPMSPAGGGIGSSIVSGLATGAAVGAGMVAGEALVHHFMDGNRSAIDPAMPNTDGWGSASDNMGGTDFGIADNTSWDDSANLADNLDVGGDDWS
jgi:hypothetical protein